MSKGNGQPKVETEVESVVELKYFHSTFAKITNFEPYLFDSVICGFILLNYDFDRE